MKCKKFKSNNAMRIKWNKKTSRKISNATKAKKIRDF